MADKNKPNTRDVPALYAALSGRRYVEREELDTLMEGFVERLGEHLEERDAEIERQFADLRREIDILKARRKCGCGSLALAPARPSLFARAWGWFRSLIATSSP